MQTPQKTLFESFFAILGPEGLETPVNGCGDIQDHKSLRAFPILELGMMTRCAFKCVFRSSMSNTEQFHSSGKTVHRQTYLHTYMYIYVCKYVYTYIHMAVTSIGGQKSGKHL